MLETLTVAMLSALLAAGAAFLFVTLRSRGSSSAEHLDAGRFQRILEAAGPANEAPAGERDRDELFAIAVASKHLLELDGAREALGKLLRDDPRDGEAWLELGLVAAYAGDHEEAARAFDRVGVSRSDLLESLTLHRAWLAMRDGDPEAAQALFGEVEIPLETKLRTDMGEGDAAFAEWFLQAGLLWRQRGDQERADWALAAARRAAPESRLIDDLSH